MDYFTDWLRNLFCARAEGNDHEDVLDPMNLLVTTVDWQVPLFILFFGLGQVQSWCTLANMKDLDKASWAFLMITATLWLVQIGAQSVGFAFDKYTALQTCIWFGALAFLLAACSPSNPYDTPGCYGATLQPDKFVQRITYQRAFVELNTTYALCNQGVVDLCPEYEAAVGSAIAICVWFVCSIVSWVLWAFPQIDVDSGMFSHYLFWLEMSMVSLLASTYILFSNFINRAYLDTTLTYSSYMVAQVSFFVIGMVFTGLMWFMIFPTAIRPAFEQVGKAMKNATST